ncbi:unnamed protein product [Chrysodeixis includens]|uniref:WD repeat-containing protein 60 n=1 Tax=Chrysodeixis includens TaxID=689277 RepID=A0A9P0FU29_CHRIL|nr:unnamed protein product [Chrysodeixis includens]
MDSSSKRSSEKPRREKQTKDDLSKLTPDEKLKKSSFTISTPRTFVQKTTTADIYGQRKRSVVQSAKAPKKSPTTSQSTSNVSPMADYLKTTPSSSQVSLRSEKKLTATKKVEAKATRPSATPRSKIANVIANSPNVKRKLNMDLVKEKSFIKDASKDLERKEKSFIRDSKKKVDREKERSFVKEVPKTKDRTKEKSFIKETGTDKKDKTLPFPGERQRTKTRTLEENEVKILTSEAVDNNAEMFNLSRRLGANPKAFYIDFDDGKPIQSKKEPAQKPSSDEDMSYEDDFESYESDFDSYHSSAPSDHNASDGTGDGDDVDGDEDDDDESEAVETIKEVKDDEKMLDSGSFDLRDQRSATKLKPALAFIFETAEGVEKPSSLTDEGFQEMSSSSAVSSMRTVHIDVLDRPLFIDFTKSKENRRKKRIGDRLRQRAKDLLSIITLHEMSYSLFEMKPISYDLYMATFGRSNYTQSAAQTFDDGITEEVQTDEVELENKWTQHPVEFTKNDICIKEKIESRRYSKNMEDYLTKFTFLTAQNSDVQRNNAINIDENYKTDPLRIYFEQKDGVGPSEMLPYDTYKTKLKNTEYNTQRLGKFLKKIESRISNVLNTNAGNTELSELKVTNMPFSKGYVSISTKHITNENISFLSKTKITQMIFSETKSNLIMTVHRDTLKIPDRKCTICLWDISVATREPIKILIAIDNIVVGRLRGATDGYFVAALRDGSIHLWDLAEQPTWMDDVANEEKPTELVEVNEEKLTYVERDREWNNKNSHVGFEKPRIACLLQSCAYTSSAHNMSCGDTAGSIVGLQLLGDPQAVSQDGRRVVGQVVSLQSTGVLTIWSIVQEKSKTVPPDIGKAFWSRMKLEKTQTISIIDHIDIPSKDQQNGGQNFNLNAAKRRILTRKQERNVIKKEVSRPKSAISFDFDIDRPSSAASSKIKRVLSVEKYDDKDWGSGLVCCDLKVMRYMNRDNYLIARNCGEVLCCRRILGAVKVNTFCVGADASSVTCVEVSPHHLPYFLAATDTGTISVCSMVENRVLLTLDCR